MSIRLPALALTAAVLLSACAPWQQRPTGPDPLARLRGHDAYGLVVAVASADITPDMRETERCVGRDEVCELLLSEGGRYQYASVKLGGTLAIDKIIVVKNGAQVGDIVRFTMPRDRTVVPLALERGARAARRKGSGCDWVDGTPETKTGGVVCNGWSYRDATPP